MAMADDVKADDVLMGIGDIQALLPHRYPFLLVDRVTSITPGERISAYKNVTVNEPFFNGHFPGHPVMPGVLILEALAQAAGILAYRSQQMTPEQKVTYLLGIGSAKFRRPLVPWERLQPAVEEVRDAGPI